jgi:succinyl-diaminopimelate desuccinylase
MTKKLLETIDARTDDLVALTTDLIRFPTVNPPGAPNISPRG